ncbi:helix-turn-helix transcriptional regulator [Rathayibacter sp. VKM Ac-2754]|uniref:helix-turn-helix transcriptional regulator n=1 Tax=Rathayibacter sp. VKM Ac-2754 TaxID=2609251 RepID=UPI00135C369B|nr:helix-turn-helix domain-containing protein [Rathayibacter sp. VKM Ac-2754]
MTMQSEVREFLTTRRARITPEKAGLPVYGGNRRVEGLRREEVAMLAGVSVDYYNRLERGNLSGVSESVLDALARALQLDDAERAHLFDLARAANLAPAKRRAAATTQVSASVQRLLDAITDAPAWVRNNRHDLLATNALGRALYADMIASPYGPPNTARFVFLDVRSRDFFPQWEKSADDIVAILRSSAGRNPYDRELSNLVGELSTRSDVFRTSWAKHDVRFHRTGTKKIHHALVGDLDLDYEAMTLDSDTDLTLLAYTARPGTPSADGLRMLASLAATRESEQAAAAEVATDPSN